MFWALAQRRKWQEQLREEGRQEGTAASRKKFEQWLAKVAEEDNLNLDRLLPPKEGSERRPGRCCREGCAGQHPSG